MATARLIVRARKWPGIDCSTCTSFTTFSGEPDICTLLQCVLPMNRWDIHVGVRISFGLSFVDSQGEPEARTADAAEFIVCVQEV